MMLEQAFKSKSNNFDILRIFASLMVLSSHSYALTKANHEPFVEFLGYDTGGVWGVSIFFVISGFLVTRSALERNVSDYLKSRILRIVPALVIVSVFDVFVIGLLFTSLPAKRFFSDPQTWGHLKNGLVFTMDMFLPGVFEGNPEKAVNGSLWTLPIECSFYIILPILYVLGLLRRNCFFLLPCATAIIYIIGVTKLGWSWNEQGGSLFMAVPTYVAVKNGLFFLLGGCLWIYRDFVPLDDGLAICCILLLIISRLHDSKWVVYFISVPYLTIYLALAHPVLTKFYHKIGDLSYGTYIFAFPIQQALVASLGAEIGPITLTLIATPLTLVMAALSWHFIERQAMAFRHKIPAHR